MNIKRVEVREIILTEFNQENGKLGIEINFENQEPSIKTILDLNIPEELAKKILNIIKRNNAPDFLKDYLALIIINQEEVELCLIRSFTFLIQKYKNMKKTKNATEYMRIYNQFKTIKEILFDKNRLNPRESRFKRRLT